MVATVLACERLEPHGELRCFLRDGPPEHFAFEILQDLDGRAWTLRVPTADRRRFLALVRGCRLQLANPQAVTFDAQGTALLGQEMLSVGDEVAGLVMDQGSDLVFALWRREVDRHGTWAWTLDAVFMPVEVAPAGCEIIERALG